jgi:hypothetical protein
VLGGEVFLERIVVRVVIAVLAMSVYLLVFVNVDWRGGGEDGFNMTHNITFTT